MSEAEAAETDAHVLARLRRGDEAAFDLLFLRHYERVYRVAFRLLGSHDEADDLTQETFLALYQRPPRLESAEHADGLAAWLCRVALNRGYNSLRGDQRRQQREGRLYQSAPQAATSDEPASTVLRAEEQERVRAVLRRLPERQSKLLLLRYAGFSYAEIARVLDVAPGSVGTLLARAERAFAQRYQAHDVGLSMTARGRV